MKTVTAEYLVSRWEDRHRVQNLMGIYSQHHLVKREGEIFTALWSEAQDVCLATNDGYYVGREAVEACYAAMHQRNVLTNRLLRACFPEKVAGKSEEGTYGMGTMNYFPLDTPVIEVAEDGKTAKGIWTLRNTYALLTAGGPEAYWQWAWVAADFIKEQGDWKIWHLQYLNDVHGKAGQPLHEPYTPYPEMPEFTEMRSFSMPEPTVKTCVHPMYTVDRPFQQPPRIPEPYAHFEETFSYGWQEKE
ncbi:MAG: nuclear transport factor 2 family protein [Oscillospiraceae bacterium]|nr:nuclear transport factor 2 family protein [Oscillospiraceae bacterium]